MRQLRQRAENLEPARFHLPSDRMEEEELQLWPVSEDDVLGLFQMLAENAALKAKIDENAAFLNNRGAMIKLLVDQFRDAIEKIVVKALREEDEEDAIAALRALPFGDFNSILATLFAITFPGGVEGFLSLWTRVTGLQLTSATPSQTDQPSATDSAASSDQLQDRPDMTEEELLSSS